MMSGIKSIFGSKEQQKVMPSNGDSSSDASSSHAGAPSASASESVAAGAAAAAAAPSSPNSGASARGADGHEDHVDKPVAVEDMKGRDDSCNQVIHDTGKLGIDDDEHY